MSKFSIIPIGGGTARYSGCPTFTGTYLKPGMLEFREIASPTPISWAVGDYVVYSRTGFTYRLYSVPQVKKQARSTEYGGAFVYQNVQFFDDSKQLDICPFRDLVPGDNRIHFSTQPSISTFEGVDGIARRLQACLDDMYPGMWIVQLATREMGASQDLVDLMAEAREFTVSGVSLLGALDKVYEVWPDVGWTFSVDPVSGKNVITIGGAGLNTPDSFQYGKGNGLVSITRTVANADELATRIFAYGSSRNMLPRWYNNQEIKDAESVDIQNLMIPVSEWGLTEVEGVELPDPAKAFIDASSAIMTRLGLRPRTYYFDGTGDLPEIYPTVRQMTIKDVRDSKSSSSDPYYPSDEIYTDEDERVDRIVSAVPILDDGLAGENGKSAAISYSEALGQLSGTGSVDGASTQRIAILAQKDFTMTKTRKTDLLVSFDGDGLVITENNFGSAYLRVSIQKGDGTDFVEIKRNMVDLPEDENGHFQMRSIVTRLAGAEVSVGDIVRVYVSLVIQNTYSSAISYSYSITPNFSFSATWTRVKTFTMSIRQIGFDINEQADLGEGKTIAMRSGACAGRSFVIKNCSYVSDTDSWELEVIRSNDESLSQWFPNEDFPIRGQEEDYDGDEFVLLDIAMPDEYILVAERRLLAAAQELLADVSVERWQYTPEIDAKFMVENSLVILPAQNMQIVDVNVVDGSTVSILVDSVTINEGEAAIPTYKVTLRDRKKKTFTEAKAPASVSSNPVTNSTQESISQISGDYYFTLDENGNVTLKSTYKNLWVPGWFAAGGVGDEGSGGGGGGLITSVKGVADLGTPIVTESLTETFSAKAIESIYEAVQERATALSLTSGGSYLLDSDGKPLKDSNGNYLVAGGDSSKVLNLLNEAGEVISSVELPIPTIDSPFVTIGEATIELGGSASLTDIGVPVWAQDEELAFASLPSLYIGRTPVKSTNTSNDTLVGIDGFTNAVADDVPDDTSMVVWEPNGGGTGIGAWHSRGNMFADGWLAAGGIGLNAGGGVSYLNNLEDVSVENLQAGDILQWDGSAYVNIPKASIATLTNHSSYSTLDVGENSVSFYDKEQVDLMIGSISPFEYIPVQTLPTADSSTAGKIYMLGPDSDNIYTLYYTKEESGSYSWVPFGTTEVNLSGYTTTEEFAQETDRVENYQQLVANGGVYRVKLDETKRIDESGMVQRRTNSDQNYAILTEISVNDVYSISLDSKYKYELLWHAKSNLVTDQFTRAGVWLRGQTVLSSLPFYADADRLRIRIYPEDAQGDPVVFATMVEELNPIIRTWREILQPVPAQVEVLKSGSLAAPGAYPANTRLFDTSVAKAGDIINYELNNRTPAGGYSEYFSIGFYDTYGVRLTYIGYDGSALSGEHTVRGSVQIPAGFAYAAITDWGGMTIVSLTTTESLDAVYSKLNNTIQKNELFDGDLSLDIAAGSDTTQNIRIVDVPFDKNGLPECLYIKCDAVSNLNIADYPLRIDCYKWVDSTLTRFAYRFYHKSNIGRYVKFDIPGDTDSVRLIASVTVESTESAQTVTYTGAKLSLSPSDKEFCLSGTTFVREHDEYGRGVYDDEIDDTAQKIVELSAKPCLVLNILTDTHENRQLKASVDITAMTLSNVKAVSRKAFSDGLVHMGDILAAGQASQYLTWDEVNDHLSEYVGRLREINERCFVCIGNHDGLEGNYVDETHTYGSLEQFNERYVVRDGIAPWFYKDYDKIKTRVVFLAVPSMDCDENGPIRYGIGENQMLWVAQTALGVPDGWNVLFFSHIHPYSGFDAGDATIFAGITTAFCNRTTYSYDGDYSLAVDYSGRMSGRVIALIAGHTHADAVIDDNSVFSSYNLSFPIVVIASSNRLVGGNADPGYTNPTRIENTISEDLWDTLVYRPDLDKIYMVRFGAGSDREIAV